MSKIKHTCPCCGFKTLDEKPPGTYDICPICFWEDDTVQYNNPDYTGGANVVSLKQAQQNFMKFGASDRKSVNSIRKPIKTDVKDPDWKPLK